MMLSQVLSEICNSPRPVTIGELSQKLEVESAVIEEMIRFWVRKGRLTVDSTVGMPAGAACHGGSCGSSCEGMENCAFMAKMPKTYSVTHRSGER